MKEVEVPKTGKCSRKEDMLQAKRPAARTTKPLVKVLLPIECNLLAQVKLYIS